MDPSHPHHHAALSNPFHLTWSLGRRSRRPGTFKILPAFLTPWSTHIIPEPFYIHPTYCIDTMQHIDDDWLKKRSTATSRPGCITVHNILCWLSPLSRDGKCRHVLTSSVSLSDNTMKRVKERIAPRRAYFSIVRKKCTLYNQPVRYSGLLVSPLPKRFPETVGWVTEELSSNA